MDQALSIKNLNEILKEDREKGGDLEEVYIPAAFSIRLKLYDLNKIRSFSHYRMRTGKITAEFYEKRIARLNLILNKWKERHDSLVIAKLDEISKLISSKDFRINVSILPSKISGKKIYGIGNSLDQILAVRFTQRTLKKIYEIKMPSRDIIVSQIKSLALDGVPKFIIIADVESFYESVRHKDILDVIHQTPELSVLIKRILTRLMKDYSGVSSSEKGLPRGIGISAYLSEIYLTSIDKEINRQKDIFYYARYVDDMVLMYSPERKESADGYLNNLGEMLKHKGLLLNNKTDYYDLLDENKGKFEYLGYEFDLSSSKKGVRLSQKKLNKYKSRIDKSFSDYSQKSLFISSKASEELIVRSLFLTGNMRLLNRKSNAFIGVYFSNKYITDTSQLKGLDKYFQNKVNGLTNPSLKRKLAKLSFEKGFKEKIFRNFNLKQLSEISRGWNHA